MQTWITLVTIGLVALHLYRGPILGTLICLPLVAAEIALGVAAVMLNSDFSTLQWVFLGVWMAILALRRLLGGRRR